MSETTHRPNLPHSPGVYLMRDTAGSIVYIGKARDLRKRVANYFLDKSGPGHDVTKVHALMSVVRHVDYIPTKSEREALLLEQRLINKIRPDFNVMWRDDKTYPYVALTLGEDFPRVILTRNRKRDGTRYFGPYPNVSRVRSLLKWAWRKKLFPLRPCKLDIKEGEPYPYSAVKNCLYLHTKECSAPCLAKISKRSYGKIVKRAEWFFEGRKDRLVRQWEKEMAGASKKMEYEKAAELRDRIGTVQHMDEQVTFREMSEEVLDSRVQRSRAVQDLMIALELKKPPELIECFDISHFQGSEMVASMVRFRHGRPDKANYRKYIIRTVPGIDDFKAMEEVVGRRYRRLAAEKAPLPDLILIDGGKGQLSSAMKALEPLALKGVELASLAKEEEEVFRPGRSESYRLPLDSPALLVLRHIRDEAHRFAITFHRHRRKGRMISAQLEELNEQDPNAHREKI